MAVVVALALLGIFAGGLVPPGFGTHGGAASPGFAPHPELRSAPPVFPASPRPAVYGTLGNWTNLTNLSGPSARSGAAMAYDPWTSEFVLFGGTTGGRVNATSPWGALQNDTWTFANGTWRNVTVAGAAPPPSPREGAVLVADPHFQGLLLFGGYGNSTDCNGGGKFSLCNAGVWCFCSGRWGFLGTSMPSGLNATVVTLDAAYDPVGGYVLVQVDHLNYTPTGAWYDAQSYEFLNRTWILLPAATPFQQGGTLVADPWMGGDLLFAGPNVSGLRDSLYRWANGTWYALGPNWTVPEEAVGIGAAPGPAGSVLAFGGFAYSGSLGVYYPDQATWLLNNSGSINLTQSLGPLPPAEGAVSFASMGNLSSGTGTALLFGGNSGSNGSGQRNFETWELTWSPPGSTGGTTLIQSFNATPSTSNTTTPIRFQGQVGPLSGPYNLTLTFGDGNRSLWSGNGGTLGFGVTHRYAQAGNYSAGLWVIEWIIVNNTTTGSMNSYRIIPLTIYNQSGGTSSAPVTVALTTNTTLGAAPLMVGFRANASGGSAPYRYAFAFGDGGRATQNLSTVSHTYTATGTYNASVVVTDTAGHSAAASVTIAVANGSGGAPIVLLRANPDPVAVDHPTTFTASVSGGSGAYTLRWTGATSDCTALTRFVEVCTPTAVGEFQLGLVVTDGRGRSGTATATVAVGTGKPSTTNPVGPAGSPVLLTPLGLGVLGLTVVVLAATIVLLARRRPPIRAKDPPLRRRELAESTTLAGPAPPRPPGPSTPAAEDPMDDFV